MNDPRFVPTPGLLVACIDQVSDCLLQASFMIDIMDVVDKDDPHAVTNGMWYTKHRPMKDLLSSNRDLGDRSLDLREITRRNLVNWRIWPSMLAIMLVSNGAIVPGQMPKSTFSIPQNEVDEFADHHLTHFYVGEEPGDTPKMKKMRR